MFAERKLVTFMCPEVLAEIFTIEATLEPLVSISFVLLLATLAFLAVFKVLIKDFFWMDIVGSLPLKVLSPFQTQ
jgi:hypothetical protein